MKYVDCFTKFLYSILEMRHANRLRIAVFQPCWDSLNSSQDEKSKIWFGYKSTEIFEERKHMAFLILPRSLLCGSRENLLLLSGRTIFVFVDIFS